MNCGSQYTRLIARRVREIKKHFCEIYPFNKIPTLGKDVEAVIMSGSPFSVRDENAPTIEYGPALEKYPYWVFVMALNILLLAKVEG
nr:hypothetical protein [Candidatus Brachybacter algidus]